MAGEATEDPIRLGTALFTLVEPHRGHEVAYNRWYEHDHFYAGCMIGEYCFSGGRFVARRAEKDLRRPRDANPITPDPLTGSYVAIYWILDGHHQDWNRWAVKQVLSLHKNGRMFTERDHVHTLLYDFDWSVQRDPDGVTAELALDRRFPGLAVVVTAPAEGHTRADLDDFYRGTYLPKAMSNTPSLALALGFTPIPLASDAPVDVGRVALPEGSVFQAWFLDDEPAAAWDELVDGHDLALADSGVGTLVWASPFIPTIPGTDTYTDQLW